MIYTITFNPAIDYVMHIGELKSGSVNRSKGDEIYFGGKGINVSYVLKELGIASKALGFVAGFTGMAIEKGVQDAGIETDFVHLQDGFSRINVKLKSSEGNDLSCQNSNTGEEIELNGQNSNISKETELNGQGPNIGEEAITELFHRLDCMADGDTLVLAGSIPDTLPSDIYERILRYIEGKQIKTVVDATGELLNKVLKYKPFLIKPNIDELGELFGVSLKNIDEVAEYAWKLKEKGAQNVLVSMAGDGAFLIDENGKKYVCGACKGKVVNSVGAGDSMVAGFIAGLKENDYEYALKLGTAAGGATAFSTGLAGKEAIDKAMREL